MRSSPRLNRGTSVIAALVFAALLGAVALGLHTIQSGTTNTSALPAQASTAITADTAQSRVPTCQQVLANAVRDHKSTPSRKASIPDAAGKQIDDSCNAAIVLPAGAIASAGAQTIVDTTNRVTYECVGMSGKVYIDGSSAVDATLNADRNVVAGKCSVQACQTGSVAINTENGELCTDANLTPSPAPEYDNGSNPNAYLTPDDGLN